MRLEHVVRAVVSSIVLSIGLITMGARVVQAQTVAEIESFYNAIDLDPQMKYDLLVQYAPRVHMAIGETFHPSSVEFFFEHVDRIMEIPDQCALFPALEDRLQFCFFFGCDPDCSDAHLGLQSYLTTKQPLTSPSDSSLYVFHGSDGQQSRPALAEAPIYAYWTRKGASVDLVYFLFFPYNRGKEQANTVFGNHVADWEHVYVRLTPVFGPSGATLAPELIHLNAHSGTGQDYPFDTFPKADGTHPIVYEAWGSHGLWANPGSHVYDSVLGVLDLVDETSAGTAWDSWNHVAGFDMLREESLPSGQAWPLWMTKDYHLLGPVGLPTYRWGNREDGCLPGTCRLENGPVGPQEKASLTSATKLNNGPEICTNGFDDDGDLANGCITEDADCDCATTQLQYTVTTTADSGPGSLRNGFELLALPRYDSSFFPDLELELSPALDGQTITLTSGPISIPAYKSARLDGETGLLQGVTISGGNASRVFDVGSGTALSLIGMRVTGGNATLDPVDDRGGAIFNLGCLYLDRSALYDNSASSGGAIYNGSSGSPGPHCNSSVGRASVSSSTLTANSSGDRGGAIANDGGFLEISEGTIVANAAGIFGGGVDNAGGTVEISNSIVAENTAAGGSSNGADIGNRGGGTVTPCCFTGYGSLSSNLIGTNDSVSTEFPPGGLVGSPGAPLNPQLSPFGVFGGLTPSFVPLGDSPVVDAGQIVSFSSCPRNAPGDRRRDQRHFRTAGLAFEIGAVESTSPYSDLVLADGPVNYYRFEGGTTQVGIDASRLECPALDSIQCSDYTPAMNRPANLGSALLSEEPSATARLGSALRVGTHDNRQAGVLIPPLSPAPVACAGAGTAMTVEAWIKIPGPVVNGREFQIAASPDFLFYVRSGRPGFSYGTSTGSYGFFNGGVEVTPDAWHHVAAVVDDDRMMFYLDGALRVELSNVGPGAPQNVGSELEIAPWADAEFFVDEVAFYQHALSDFQIQRHFEVGTGCDESPDSFAVTSPGVVSSFETPVDLEAKLLGIDPPGSSPPFVWEVVSGNASVGPPTVAQEQISSLTHSRRETASLSASSAGPVRVRVQADDGRCGNVAEIFRDIYFDGPPTVSTLQDSAVGAPLIPGSLRERVANASTGATIFFDAALSGGAIALSSGDIVIDRDLTLDASALQAGVKLDGMGLDRIFTINPGVSVSLIGLELRNGSTTTSGGAIHNSGTLTLADCTIEANHANDFAGGLYNDGATTIERCTFSGNTAYDSAALWNSPGRSLTLINTTVSGNHAVGNGGAMLNYQGNVELIHATISGNTAGTYGGGIDNDSGTVVVENSIVAGNSGPPPGSAADIGNRGTGSVVASGNNLIGDNESVGIVFPQGPLVGTRADPRDPMLLPLGDYGGPTRTMRPLANAPAIDAALPTPRSPATDQRGVVRPIGPAADLGATEAEILLPPVVVSGTHGLANGMSLSILQNNKQAGGAAFLIGGSIHSPSGAPDLFFRAGSTPTFPGALDSYVEWSISGFESSPGVWAPFPWEGAVSGSDNWMKVIREADGAVSWAQFEFDFSPGAGSDPILRDILLYVERADGTDLSLAEAVAAVPEPGIGWMLAAGVVGLAVARRSNDTRE